MKGSPPARVPAMPSVESADRAIAALAAKIAGGSVVCLASGPSLTPEDVELVRAWRFAAPGRAVIVANNTASAAPWADALFAMDRAWWDAYRKDLSDFQGQRFSTSVLPSSFGVVWLRAGTIASPGVSGGGCIALAARAGAKRIGLLGYDCQHTGGRAHWHADHGGKLGNAKTVAKWPARFRVLAARIGNKASIVNCSRETALDVFPRVALEEFLAC